MPTAAINAVNFANGTLVQVSHRQIFTIASTAIVITTDIIALGNDSNGSASAFRTTTPNTLIRFSLGTPDPPAQGNIPSQSVFTNQVPSSLNGTDASVYELGMKFRSTKAGLVNSIRHYKASSETGTHIGRIWSSSGVLLGSVTFTDETASGWQQQNLATPLAILANTTYVVSVNINTHYSSTSQGLSASTVTGDLSSVADGNNGIYNTVIGSFPNLSSNNSNYFRDVAFTPDAVVALSVSTLPVSTPQVQDNGLYYFKSGGQLSITENGSAINFATQGSGNFILIAESELNNSTVSGGLGYSAVQTFATGASVRVKAVHFTESAGIATSSKFFDDVFAWSSSGITIFDTVNNLISSSKEPIHEQIVAVSTLTLESSIDNAFGIPINSITLPNSGSAVTSLSLALEGVGKLQINANKPDGLISWQELFLWGCYVRSTIAGIRLVSAATFSANNFYNYEFNNLEFDDTILTPLYFVGGVGRSGDGRNIVSPSTTGSVILNALSWGTGAIVPISGGGGGGGGTAPTAIQIRQEMDAGSIRLAAIDAKTAALNFTGANVQAIIATLPTIPVNWITAAGINAAAFTAAKFGPDSIDSNAIASSAVLEIQTGLATVDNFSALTTLVGSRATPADLVVNVSGGFLLGDRSALVAIKQKTDLFSFTGVNVNAAIASGGFSLSDRSLLSSTSINAAIARKGVTNRYKINEVTNTGTLYGDDGTTSEVIHNLKNISGNPSSSSVFERVP